MSALSKEEIAERIRRLIGDQKQRPFAGGYYFKDLDVPSNTRQVRDAIHFLAKESQRDSSEIIMRLVGVADASDPERGAAGNSLENLSASKAIVWHLAAHMFLRCIGELALETPEAIQALGATSSGFRTIAVICQEIGANGRALAPELLRILDVRSGEYEQGLCEALASVAGQDPDLIREIAMRLHAPSPYVRANAIGALWHIGPSVSEVVPSVVNDWIEQLTEGACRGDEEHAKLGALASIAPRNDKVAELLIKRAASTCEVCAEYAVDGLGESVARLDVVVPTLVDIVVHEADDIGESQLFVPACGALINHACELEKYGKRLVVELRRKLGQLVGEHVFPDDEDDVGGNLLSIVKRINAD